MFSFLGRASDHPRQVDCFITATNERTHEIIRQATDRSPMFTGVIEGGGTALLPVRGRQGGALRGQDLTPGLRRARGVWIPHEVYPNGISTSLPFDVQHELVRSIRGFEAAHLTRPGYAIEYDFFDPRELSASLQTRAVGGLFFAGQINGTTGYEEGGRQGLLAGINAVQAGARAGALDTPAQRGLPRRAGGRPHHPRRPGTLSDVHHARRTPAAAARRQCRPAPDSPGPRTGSRGRGALATLQRALGAGAGRIRAPREYPCEAQQVSVAWSDRVLAGGPDGARSQRTRTVAPSRGRLCRCH